jgi:VWFA-related protein
MKNRNSSIPLLLAFLALALPPLLFQSDSRVASQTRERRVNPGDPSLADNSGNQSQTPAEVVKVDVDLVTIDALVLQKQTARMIGGLKKEDFLLYEDGAKQDITLFTQDNLPLSVLLLIDRGGCLDPYGDTVQRAAVEAVRRLKPEDEVAVMTYHDTTDLLQGFTRDRGLVEKALAHVPHHEEEAQHCLNVMFADAADYMVRAGNPVGRRVVILITGVTRNFDCRGGPSGKSAARAIYESGSVVCGVIPKNPIQAVENGVMIWATRMGKLGGAPYLDVQTLANETGGEMLSDKPENLDTTFQTLMEHLRSRYNLAYVSTNRKRDGATRKLKLDLQPSVQQSSGKLVIKSRRSYVAPKN